MKMRTLLLCSPLLFVSAALSAQTVSTPTSTVDTTTLPLVSTPEVALPGSGMPVNSGVVDVNANNVTNNPAGVVYTPGSASPAAATALGESGNTTVTAPAAMSNAASTTPSASASADSSRESAEPVLLNTGITNFQSGANGVPAAQQGMSLGDVARYYKQQKQTTRTDNATGQPSAAPQQQ